MGLARNPLVLNRNPWHILISMRGFLASINTSRTLVSEVACSIFDWFKSDIEIIQTLKSSDMYKDRWITVRRRTSHKDGGSQNHWKWIWPKIWQVNKQCFLLDIIDEERIRLSICFRVDGRAISIKLDTMADSVPTVCGPLDLWAVWQASVLACSVRTVSLLSRPMRYGLFAVCPGLKF